MSELGPHIHDRVALRLGPGLAPHPSRTGAPGDGLARMPDYGGIAEAVVDRGEREPDTVSYFIFDEQERLTSLSNAGMLAWARELAGALDARGIARGHRVLICFDTCPELLALVFGCSLIGAVPVLLEPPHGRARLQGWRARVEHMNRRAQARALIVDGRLRELAGASAPELLVLTPAELRDTPPFSGQVRPRPEELAFIQFSSGTTSEAKGVMVSNRALVTNLRCMGAKSRYRADEMTVGWLPLHHDMGLLGAVLWPLVHGTAMALMPPLSFILRPQRWLWAIHHFRANMSVAPNFGYQLCVNKIAADQLEGLDLSAWRLALNGAEFVLERTLEQFSERFAAHGFDPKAHYPVYGMAETVVAASFPEPGQGARVDHVARGPASASGEMQAVPREDPEAISFVGVGRPFPEHAIRIVDDAGEVLPDRREGQILLSGPSLCEGYVGLPERSAEVFRDGWLWTGDLGYLVEGELFVSGRIKDLIIKGGRNYHPHGFEAAAREVPGVRPGGVAAFGVRDPESGTEAIYLVVETALERDDERLAVRDAVLEVVYAATGVRLDRVVPVSPRTVPKTSSGKVQRNVLRDKILAAEDQRGTDSS